MIKLLQWNIWNNENIDNIIKELKRIKADTFLNYSQCNAILSK